MYGINKYAANFEIGRKSTKVKIIITRNTTISAKAPAGQRKKKNKKDQKKLRVSCQKNTIIANRLFSFVFFIQTKYKESAINK